MASLVNVTGSTLAVRIAGGIHQPISPFAINPGNLQAVTTGSAATGTWKWDLFYVPLDLNASVAAA
jgi:hypothetical protein